MKRILILAILILGLTACGSAMFMTASDYAREARMGMTVHEFEEMTGNNATLYERTLHGVIFSINEYSGPIEHRYVSGYKLFHFNAEGRLFRIETRLQQPVYGNRLGEQTVWE